MKRLTLLRHAKSTWDDPVSRDFDRPLNPRGRRAARTIGAEMRVLGLAFDSVIASPARRVMETLGELEQAFDLKPKAADMAQPVTRATESAPVYERPVPTSVFVALAATGAFAAGATLSEPS